MSKYNGCIKGLNPSYSYIRGLNPKYISIKGLNISYSLISLVMPISSEFSFPSHCLFIWNNSKYFSCTVTVSKICYCKWKSQNLGMTTLFFRFIRCRCTVNERSCLPVIFCLILCNPLKRITKLRCLHEFLYNVYLLSNIGTCWSKGKKYGLIIPIICIPSSAARQPVTRDALPPSLTPSPESIRRTCHSLSTCAALQMIYANHGHQRSCSTLFHFRHFNHLIY